jgi:hypothetical protein
LTAFFLRVWVGVVFVFVAILLSGYVIYCTGFDPAFGWFPLLSIIGLLATGAGADAAWWRLRQPPSK